MLSTIGLVFLSWAASAPAHGQASEEQIIEHFRAGQSDMKDGQFVRATEEFKAVLALDPKLVEAEVNLGLAYQSMSQYEFAMRHLESALRKRPALPAPNLIVGADYLKLGFPAKAVPFLKQALKLDPTNREARRTLALSYLSQGNFGGAAEEFRQAALLDPNQSDAWFKLGHDYLELSARLAYRGARLYRESAWGHRFLADLLFQRSRWDGAGQEYRKALAIDPKQSGLHTALGQIFLQQNKVEEAENEFHLDLLLDPENESALLGIAEKHLIAGQTSAALEPITKVWQVSPEFLSTQRDFPSVDLGAETLQVLLGTLQTFPDGAPKDFLLASLYATTGDKKAYDSQWKRFQDEITERQKVPPPIKAGLFASCPPHRYATCLHSLEGRKALTDSQRLLLGKTQAVLRQYDRAAESLSPLTSTLHDDGEASYWLTLSYRALGAEAFARLEESFPDSWRNHQLRGEGHALRGDYESALREFQLAFDQKPDQPELHEAMGEVYLDQQSDDDARKELEAALAQDPSRPHALCLLGRLYVQQRANDKAVPYLQKALQLQPDLVEASSLLGTAYVRLGHFADAIPKLQRAAALDVYGNVHYQLFLAYSKLGQPQLAKKALSRSKELQNSSLERDQAVVMGAPNINDIPQ